ncbi:putative nucleic-acid-binding protein, contains PIN domain [Archaeoglobus sulfaticallidus PM70-1]|uniref:Putative nucleic-acid-binding protein, contains PIN domain n=1 Tax=Archaeoglobus sulfaticallidus PM70-1 TaxID=387631 RepID=N0BG72_9EURY|nr:PIN domain-containing protein [Archaeoglobus sulfaticallidus]AGK61297.1 putative nucleic-acid-binding protein, contains PIN domain [Archaeoglobus sulfaticallidus PM70-1]
MSAFFDVNVFMDVLERRRGWKASLAVVQLVRNGKIEGYVSALTPPIIYFLRARYTDENRAREDARRILREFRIVPLTEEIILNSYEESRIDDFEDCIQFHSALSTAEVLITRNIKDFEAVKDEIAVMTPEEFLTERRERF